MNNSMVQRAICVLGMHRSGTSAVTRILNLMGVDLGTNLMPPAPENPKGFWENLDFVEIDEALLTHLKASWDEIAPVFIDSESWSQSEFFPFKDKIKNLVTSEFPNSKLWGWKDPRTCLLFPLWLETLNSQNIQTDAVIIWRNPISVAKSLTVRNGFSANKGYHLWYAYTISALYHTRHLRRVIINYDSLLEDWQSEMRRVTEVLTLPWPKDEPDFVRSVESFLRPSLRHSFAPYDETMKSLPTYAAELYTFLMNHASEAETTSPAKLEFLYSLYSSMERTTPHTEFRPEEAGVTLYHSNNGLYSEEECFHVTSLPTQKSVSHFDLVSNGPLHLRLDPLDRPGILDELLITVVSESQEVLFSANLESLTSDVNGYGINLLDCQTYVHENNSCLIATSHDPQILLPPLEYSGLCHITLSIRTTGYIPVALTQVMQKLHIGTFISKNTLVVISSLEQSVASLTSDLAQLTSEKNALQQQITHLNQLDEFTTKLSHQVHNQHAELADLKTTMTRNNEQHAATSQAQTEAISSLKNNIESLSATIDLQMKENVAFREEILQMQTSLSWRISKPLRDLARRLTKL